MTTGGPDDIPGLAGRIAGRIVERMERSKTPIPVGISNRHLHLCQEHWDILFGAGAAPQMYRRTRQPGWWAAKELVALESPKLRLDGVRILAPHRKRTQVEVSRTDAFALGLTPPVAGSGNVQGSASVRIIGPKGAVDAGECLIVSQRHLHLSPADSAALGIKDGELLRVRAGAGGPRELVFEKVLARVSDTFALELHLDTDEANAAWLKSGDFVHIC